MAWSIASWSSERGLKALGALFLPLFENLRRAELARDGERNADGAAHHVPRLMLCAALGALHQPPPRKTASERVRAMEIAIAMSPEDYRAHTSGAGQEGGFRYSGSFAGRNIEKIYALGGLEGSLEAAVLACFAGPRRPEHVLVVSGFYVLHGRGGNPGTEPGVAAGSCETDGPLGALALLRAFAARGVRASLYCEPHNGPVMRAGYEAMLRHYDAAADDGSGHDGGGGAARAMAARLRSHTRCLPDAPDRPVPGEDTAAYRAAYTSVFGGEAAGVPHQPEAVRCRAVRCAASLGAAVAAAWRDEPVPPPPIDCLFAVERLGAPYRNIRGVDIAKHTEPIDALWPLASPPVGSAAAARLEAWLEGGEAAAGAAAAGAGAAQGDIGAAATAALRSLAGVHPDALSLAIGDGGNEVGMGRAVLADEIAELSPGGEFAPLRVNGCYRGCDHLVAATVSNWGGTAFEAAACVLCPQEALDYRQQPQRPGQQGAGQQAQGEEAQGGQVEEAVLAAIMAQPYGAVDGKYSEMAHAVDGLAWEPYHRELYEHLWQLAAAES